MQIHLSDHFTYKRLLRFVLPSVCMMIFISLYTVVDGFFVSNFVGKTPFAALNLMWPVIMAISTVGFMIGTGGSAVVSKTFGEDKKELGNRYFSMLVYVITAGGLLLSLLGVAFTRRIALALGAEGEMLAYAIRYGRILFGAEVFFILQTVLQNFMIMAEKPGLSFRISLAAGVTNMILDYVFIVSLDWGLEGAALATVAGQMVGAGIPLLYFSHRNSSLLRLGKTRFYGRILVHACVNGSSEMVANLAGSIVGMLYNFQLLRLVGENGVAAYGIIMYVNFLFAAIYFGYAMGSAPLVGFHYGAQNRPELHNLFRKSLILLTATGLVLTISAEVLAVPLVKIFASYDRELLAMTLRGFRIFSLIFVIMGVNIWGSAFFTALNNGVVSAVIAFCRTLVFETASVLVLPVFFRLDGVWCSALVAEALALGLTAFFFLRKDRDYGYLHPETGC